MNGSLTNVKIFLEIYNVSEKTKLYIHKSFFVPVYLLCYQFIHIYV